MLSKNWFSEKNTDCWPGQAFSLEVEQLLHQEKTKYQEIVLFQRLESLDVILVCIILFIKCELNFR